jgi:hypothetical protein
MIQLEHASVHGADNLDELLSHSFCAGIEGLEVNWNVGRMRGDAEAGAFGPSKEFATSALPIERGAHALDQAKVERFKTLPEILAMPAMILASPAAHFLCDGIHRVAAICEMGRGHFSAYVVPWEVEARYRITVEYPSTPKSTSSGQ